VAAILRRGELFLPHLAAAAAAAETHARVGLRPYAVGGAPLVGPVPGAPPLAAAERNTSACSRQHPTADPLRPPAAARPSHAGLPGVILAAGHEGSGLCLGPATAELVAAYALGGDASAAPWAAALLPAARLAAAAGRSAQ